MKDEQHEKMMDQAAIFKDGMETVFWKYLRVLLYEYRMKAMEDLVSVASDDRGLIAELQAWAKIPVELERKLLDTIAYGEQAKQ